MRPNQLPFDQLLQALFEGGPPTPAMVEVALRACANCGYYAGAHDLLLDRFEADPFGAPEESYPDLAAKFLAFYGLRAPRAPSPQPP